jgi:hypothetical protein
LPLAALRAADQNRAALVPCFLAEIEGYIAADSEQRRKPNAVFFIFHLLGSWREQSAYRPLTALLRSPSEDIDRLLGDFSTETSHRVMSAVFDGDPRPLEHIVLDENADQFIRSRMLESLAMLTLRGVIGRDYTTQFLRRCWDELQPRLDCYAWEGWQSAIAMLGLTSLKPLVLRAFAAGCIDPFWLTVANFESNLAYALRHSGGLPVHNKHEYELFGDTIDELARYHFAAGCEADWEDEPDAGERDGRQQMDRLFNLVPYNRKPIVNRFKTLGRNDPCPCGSGRKYKKCCLEAPIPAE